MCRSIKTLRKGEVLASEEEIKAAALQFVRKVSGFQRPSPANAEAFNRAVEEIAHASERLLRGLRLGRRLPARNEHVDDAAGDPGALDLPRH